MVSATGVEAAGAESPLSGPQIFGWGFSGPYSIASDGTHVWVADDFGDSVIELDASTGAEVQVVYGSGLNAPDAIASDGTHVWVANLDGNSVTELDASTGALVQALSGSSFRYKICPGRASGSMA